MSPAPEPIQQIPKADWVDQDLLTKELAADLLSKEIEAEKDRLDHVEDVPGRSESDTAAARLLRERRVAAMENIRSTLSHDAGEGNT